MVAVYSHRLDFPVIGGLVKAMHLLETYLRELSVIRSSGSAVAETSYYPPFRTF